MCPAGPLWGDEGAVATSEPRDNPDAPVRKMSPRDIEPFDGIPGFCALARDRDHRLLWCNQEFARLQGTTPEAMRGSTLYSLLPGALADERMTLMEPTLRSGALTSYLQIWRGSSWITRVWPLDEQAFGKPGMFLIIQRIAGQAAQELAGTEGVQLAQTSDLAELSTLSDRELEVLYLLARGMTAKEVARVLHRSEKTIDNHMAAIHRKLGITSRAELVRMAVERGLLGFSREQWGDIVGHR